MPLKFFESDTGTTCCECVPDALRQTVLHQLQQSQTDPYAVPLPVIDQVTLTLPAHELAILCFALERLCDHYGAQIYTERTGRQFYQKAELPDAIFTELQQFHPSALDLMAKLLGLWQGDQA